MFGLFKKKVPVSELAQSSEILSVAENGDYKAFLIRVPCATKIFSESLQAEGGQKAVQRFVDVIENRIKQRDFDDIFSDVNQMHRDYATVPKRNTNVERVILCADHDGYFFKWSP
jgi:hypothetical protein